MAVHAERRYLLAKEMKEDTPSANAVTTLKVLISKLEDQSDARKLYPLGIAKSYFCCGELISTDRPAERLQSFTLAFDAAGAALKEKDLAPSTFSREASRLHVEPTVLFKLRCLQLQASAGTQWYKLQSATSHKTVALTENSHEALATSAVGETLKQLIALQESFPLATKETLFASDTILSNYLTLIALSEPSERQLNLSHAKEHAEANIASPNATDSSRWLALEILTLWLEENLQSGAGITAKSERLMDHLNRTQAVADQNEKKRSLQERLTYVRGYRLLIESQFSALLELANDLREAKDIDRRFFSTLIDAVTMKQMGRIKQATEKARDLSRMAVTSSDSSSAKQLRREVIALLVQCELDSELQFPIDRMTKGGDVLKLSEKLDFWPAREDTNLLAKLRFESDYLLALALQKTGSTHLNERAKDRLASLARYPGNSGPRPLPPHPNPARMHTADHQLSKSEEPIPPWKQLLRALADRNIDLSAEARPKLILIQSDIDAGQNNTQAFSELQNKEDAFRDSVLKYNSAKKADKSKQFELESLRQSLISEQDLVAIERNKLIEISKTLDSLRTKRGLGKSTQFNADCLALRVALMLGDDFESERANELKLLAIEVVKQALDQRENLRLNQALIRESAIDRDRIANRYQEGFDWAIETAVYLKDFELAVQFASQNTNQSFGEITRRGKNQDQSANGGAEKLLLRSPFICYYIGQSNSHVFWRVGHEIQHARLTRHGIELGRNEISALVSSVRSFISTKPFAQMSEEFLRNRFAESEILLPKRLRDDFAGRDATIYVTMHGPMLGLPLQSLPVGFSTNGVGVDVQYLIDDLPPLVYRLSLLGDAATSEPSSTAEPSFLTVQTTDDVGDESKKLMEMFISRNFQSIGHMVQPSDLNKRQLVLQKLRKKWRWVHFGTHGFIDPEDGGWLQIENTDGKPRLAFQDILHTKRQGFEAELVFLSACETQVASEEASNVEGGSSLDSVGTAFLIAGAHNVISTNWRIDNKTTEQIVKDFFDVAFERSTSTGDHDYKIVDNYAKTLKLVCGRIKASPETSHPYYWGSFTLWSR
jgi:hypothetical protein